MFAMRREGLLFDIIGELIERVEQLEGSQQV